MRRFFLGTLAVLATLSTALSAEAKKEKRNEGLRIMSFNIRVDIPQDTGELSWASREPGCIKAIEKYKPDVIGFQEVFTNQESDLVKDLKKYQVVDRSGKPGTVNPDISFNVNPIMYRSDRFELLDYGYFWLNEDQAPEKFGWDARTVRNSIWVKLKVRKSGKIFFYFNAHFDHQGKVAREESSKLMVERIKAIAGDDAVVFMGGDLNMESTAKEIKPLQDYLQEANTTARKADKAATYTNFGRKGSKPMWLDHIFYRNADVLSFEVVDEHKFGVEYISDHYPVVSDFRF